MANYQFIERYSSKPMQLADMDDYLFAKMQELGLKDEDAPLPSKTETYKDRFTFDYDMMIACGMGILMSQGGGTIKEESFNKWIEEKKQDERFKDEITKYEALMRWLFLEEFEFHAWR